MTFLQSCLRSLANEAGYSRGHFLNMFRASTGLTPHRYLVNRRVVRARILLERRDRTLIDIAIACGFSSQAHMSQVFREKTGVTPGEYRRIKLQRSALKMICSETHPTSTRVDVM